MGLWLAGLSQLYKHAADFKNFLYDHQYIKTTKVSAPVISVGNLTVGGTGKTPLTDFLLKKLINQGARVALVARAYRAQADKPVLLDRKLVDGARIFGDEAFLLAQRNAQVDVFVGQSKYQIAEMAVGHQSYDYLLVDDGFQHRKLHRDLDILILDATESFQNYKVLPEGRAREPWESLQRADLIVLTKVNLVEPIFLDQLLAKIPTDKKIIYTDYKITEIFNSRTQEVLAAQTTKKEAVWLLSAIARPSIFEKMMAESFQVKGHNIFRDHHSYSRDDLQKALHQAALAGARLVVTEKDAVKIKALGLFEDDFWVAGLSLTVIKGEELLDEAIAKISSC